MGQKVFFAFCGLVIFLVGGLVGAGVMFNLTRASEQAIELRANIEHKALQSEIVELEQKNTELAHEAEENGWPRYFQCTVELDQANKANESWRKWGEQVQTKLAAQQQGSAFTADDAKMLLQILKLLL